MANESYDSNGLTGTNPITVVILLHTIAYGGIETILINWLKHIDKRRFNLHLLCFSNPGGTEQPFVQAAQRAGLTVNTDIAWSRRKPAFRAARQLAQYIKAVGADIVHTHNTYASLVGWLATRNTHIKLMTTLYVWANLGWKQNILQWLDCWLIRRFDLVTAQCLQTLKDTEALGIPLSKIRLLVSGFETDFAKLSPNDRRQRRQALGIDDDTVVYVNVARLYPEKAQDKLLECFSKLASKRANVKLWILGCGPLEASLQAYCSKLGLADRVRWFGFVEDLLPTLQLADVMVHPSHAEGVPLAVCSGLAVGLPVIASDVGGIREVLRNGSNGFLIPAAGHSEFPAIFINAMNELAEHSGQRQRLGIGAARFIAEEYSMEVAMQQLESCYLSLITP